MHDLETPPPCSHHLGFSRLEQGSEGVRVHFLPTQGMVNPRGVVQGGLLSAMLDDTVGVTVAMMAPSRLWTTLELSTHFLSPALPDQELVGEAKCIHEGRRTFFMEAKLLNPEGTCVAVGTFTCVWQGRAGRELETP